MTDAQGRALTTTAAPSPGGRGARQPAFVPGMTRAPGRPGYLTREVEEKFMTALRAGNSISDAARYCGLKPATVHKWLARGRGNDSDRPATAEYVRFARLTEESRATARVYVVGNLVSRTRQDTRAAELWLRVHGGPEWREGELPVGVPAVAPGTTVIDAREQSVNVLVVPAEHVPDTVRALLAERRAHMVDPPIIAAEPQRTDGDSASRRAGLREDG